MGFAVIFYVFFVLFLWLGGVFRESQVFIAPLMSLIFYQAAIAEFFTGSLYLVNFLFHVNPGGLFKSPQGKLYFLPRLLAWPYLLFEYWGWRRYREKGAEPLFEEVRDGLFLGARITDLDLPALEKSRITVVIDMVAEFRGPAGLLNNRDIEYLAMPALDGTTPAIKEIEMGARLVKEAVEAGRNVLVHCTFGHGRSATMAAAALIIMDDAKDPAAALQILGRLKRRIWLSNAQKGVLREFSSAIR